MRVETKEFCVSYALCLKASMPVIFDAGRIIGGYCVDHERGVRQLQTDLAMTPRWRIGMANLVSAAGLHQVDIPGDWHAAFSRRVFGLRLQGFCGDSLHLL